ncbi:hypothetical protein D3C86_1601340 [compost metagenome]
MLRVAAVFHQYQVIGPQRCTFDGDAVFDFHSFSGFVGGLPGTEHRAGPGQGHTDIAVGQVTTDFRRIEIGDVRAQFQHERFGFFVVIGVAAVGREAKVVQGDRHDLGGRVEYSHPTLTEFGQVLLFEQQVP